jgi:uncharacterized phage protein gp47/JayE
MAFPRPTVWTIYNRIRADLESRVTGGVPIPPVSFLGIMDLVFSGAIHLTYGFLEWIYRQIFMDLSDEIGCRRWGSILNVPRKPAVHCTGSVAFTGTAGEVVPSGSEIVNADGYTFITETDFTIGTSVSVVAVAETAGADFNTYDSVMSLTSAIDGVDSTVAIVSGFTNGEDQATLIEWKDDILFRLQNPPRCGSAADYRRWAKEADVAVRRVWCFPAEQWAGAGTVGLCVAMSDLSPVSADVLSTVSAYVEGVRPVPARIAYFTVTPLSTSYYLSMSPNNDDTLAAAEAALRKLHVQEAGPSQMIKLTHIYGALSSVGLDDYEITDITVGGSSVGVGNIFTLRPNCAVFGSVVPADM